MAKCWMASGNSLVRENHRASFTIPKTSANVAIFEFCRYHSSSKCNIWPRSAFPSNAAGLRVMPESGFYRIFELFEPAAHRRVMHSQMFGDRVQPIAVSVVEKIFLSNAAVAGQLEDRSRTISTDLK